MLYKALPALALSTILAIGFPFGWFGDNDESSTESAAATESSSTESEDTVEEETADSAGTSDDGRSVEDDGLTKALDIDEEEAPSSELTEDQIQANNLAMLNYLTVLAQDVNASRGSRLKLETMYSDLFNNTRADRIDRSTRDEILVLSNTIESYRMVTVKRERLEYLNEQRKAAAMREAVPNPVAVLSAVHSRSLPDILLSIGYMAVDSYTGYKNAVNDANLQYLTEGWELDDEQAATLHAQNQSMFSYMWDMVNEHNLPGDLALSNSDVEKLVKWKNESNVVSRIQFLESNEETYRAYGGYWLILAGSYYENGDYQKCLDSMNRYEEVRTVILRKDHDYAAALPLAIASASETMGDAEYVEYASKRVGEIIKNSEDTNWELRYLAAQTYVDLYSVTGDDSYLQSAYIVVLDNVNNLVGEQREQNDEYLSVIVGKSAPADATKDEKKEIDKYNKKLREERKTALPPVYQPLLVNCDMLFALADKLDVPEADRTRIEGILHPKGAAIFLTEPLDARYRMTPSDEESDSGDVMLEETKIVLPATLLSDASAVTVTTGKKAKEIPGKWTVKKVKRGSGEKVGTFEATLENKDAKGSYSDGDTVIVTITDGEGSSKVERTYQFKAKVEKHFIFSSVSFERV